jgi:thiamine kinase-like enzyme
MAVEARTMEYARQHGFPVPAVQEVSGDGTELVMERIDGATMLTVLGKRPWTVPRQGTVLAELHQRLHEIPAPDWIGDAPCGRGDRLVHLDLHPLNVLVTKTGPVVIDWPNAARGDGNADIALTWVLIAAGGVPPNRIRATAEGWGRSIMIRSILKRFDRSAVRAQLAAVVEWKSRDPHTSESERVAMRQLVQTAR